MIDRKCIEKELSTVLKKKDLTIVDLRTTNLSQNNSTYYLETSTNKKFFLKLNSNKLKGMFDAEAFGLKLLKKNKSIVVPKVISNFHDNDNQCLILEHIESGKKENDFFYNLGVAVATMHKEDTAAMCGLKIDNYIGKNHQINKQSDDWIAFFAEHRLLYQLKLAEKNGYADVTFSKKLATIIEKTDKILPRQLDFSLLHGDFWGGNYMCNCKNRPVLIDPACYYGDREADIAMTELFGGFSPDFYNGYNDVNPLDSGYKDRKDFYNLYHLLNHLNLFGKTYIAGCKKIIQHYL